MLTFSSCSLRISGDRICLCQHDLDVVFVYWSVYIVVHVHVDNITQPIINLVGNSDIYRTVMLFGIYTRYSHTTTSLVPTLSLIACNNVRMYECGCAYECVGACVCLCVYVCVCVCVRA